MSDSGNCFSFFNKKGLKYSRENACIHLNGLNSVKHTCVSCWIPIHSLGLHTCHCVASVIWLHKAAQCTCGKHIKDTSKVINISSIGLVAVRASWNWAERGWVGSRWLERREREERRQMIEWMGGRREEEKERRREKEWWKKKRWNGIREEIWKEF